MKERPILMSAPMVRAILAGRKTQTRRVMKPQPSAGITEISQLPATDPYGGFMVSGDSGLWEDRHGCDERWRCPYGVPGDRLWVKETWAPHRPHLRKTTPRLLKKNEVINYAAEFMPDDLDGLAPWQSPLFMMRHQSRIVLEVTGVRVERLHDISEADAEAEGVERNEGDAAWTREDGWLKYPVEKHLEDFPAFTARESYQTLWESINNDPAKPHAHWSANPWVWVVEFKRV